MKKIIYLPLLYITLSSAPFTSFAEPSEVETAQMEEMIEPYDETSDKETPSEEPEVEMPETAAAGQPEESETSETAENPYLETVAKLTEQQLREGYRMIDGKIYSPKELTDAQKNSGIHYGGVMPSKDTGFVAFAATLPPGIHDDVYVTVINVNTYETYQTVLYEVNSLASTINLPDGNYILSKCGLTADIHNRFFTESSRFTVNRGSYSVVNIDVLDSESEVKSDKQVELENGNIDETVSGKTTETTASYEEKMSEVADSLTPDILKDTKKTEKKASILNILFMMVSIGIPIYIIGKFLFGNRQKNDDEY